MTPTGASNPQSHINAQGQPDTADFNLETVHRPQFESSDETLDRRSHRFRLGGASTWGEAHIGIGVGDQSRLLALLGDAKLTARLVGRDDRGGALESPDPREQLAHRRPHGRVVDTLLGPEHDRAPGPGAHAPEALL